MKHRELDKRSVALLDELEALLANPRAVEIVANDWLHDGSLPVPSLDLMRYFAFRMLTGHGIKIEATKNDRNGLIELLVKHLRNEKPVKRAASITSALDALDCFKCEHTHGKKDASGPHLHEWLGLLWPYLYPDAPEDDDDAVRLKAGERMIARGLIEAMMHRALFTMDYGRIQSLAAAMRMIRFDESPKPTLENRVMGEILRCMPYLNERLTRQASRMEIEEFIRERAALMNQPPFPKYRNQWTEAFDKLNYHPADGRTIRRDQDLIVKLARESCNNMG